MHISMKSIAAFFFLVIGAALPLAAENTPATEPLNATVPADFVQHKASDGSTIKAPPGWTEKAPPNPQIALMIMADDKQSYVTLVMAKIPPIKDLKPVVEASIQQVSGMVQKFKLLDKKYFKLNGLEAAQFEYTATAQSIDFHFRQIIIATPTGACVVMFTIPAGKFDKYGKVMDPMLVSLAVKKEG